METSEREIVLAVLAGERERFELLVDRHGPSVLGFLSARSRDREEVKELFQATWVRAFERLRELREPERMRAWLITIAHNELLMLRRSARPFEELGEALVPAAAASPSAGERAEELERVRRAIRALPLRQREVFELRVARELDHAQIASLLGITAENARANFYQALKSLRAALGTERT